MKLMFRNSLMLQVAILGMLQVAMLGVVATNSARAEAPSDSDTKLMPESRYLGVFKLGPDQKLTRVQTPLGDPPLPPAWFQADLSDGWWTNRGSNATVNPNPPNLPRAYNEYVSHGQGIAAGATITGFRVQWVSGAVNTDVDAGPFDLNMLVSFYDGRNDTNTATAPVEQFAFAFTFQASERQLGGWFADILLDPVDHFVMPGTNFEYGLKLLEDIEPVSFGPFLHQNIPGQTAGAEGDAVVGKTYNIFEAWVAPTPPTDGYGQYNLASGLFNGGPFFYNFEPGAGQPAVPWAAAIFTAYYEPAPGATIDSAYVVHNGYTGAGSNKDAGKVVHKETGTPTALTYANLINTTRGLNGVGFDVTGLANPGGISAADFEFQMSPTGAFNEGANPPSGWAPAPAPISVVVNPGPPDSIVISWNNNDIKNRWLRITVKANANTGLATDEVYYIGHLLGESGPATSTYTVAFADITPIRAAVGNTVDSSSTVDLDKNGTVAFADISPVTTNIGTQLTNITVP